MARGDDDADVTAIDEAPGVVAPPERIDAWLSVAKTGDEFVYATRCFLPLGSAGATRMRELAEADLVLLYQRRPSVEGSRHYPQRNYVARRSSKKLPAAAVPPVKAARERGNTDTDAMNAVLPLLKRAARFDRPCPTNAQMAQRAGLTADEVGAAIEALKSANVIRVTPFKAPTLRLVTIVENGHRTGLVQGGTT